MELIMLLRESCELATKRCT